MPRPNTLTSVHVQLARVLLLASWLPTAAFATPCEGITLPLVREATGHVSTQLVVEGRPVRFLVDTGANVNTLDKTEGPKLKPTLTGTDPSRPGEGYTQLQVGTADQALGLQPFAVMDLSFINVGARRRGTEPFAGQLGAAFFEAFAVRIDFGAMTLCVGRVPIAK